jgi:hypothetical protein
VASEAGKIRQVAAEIIHPGVGFGDGDDSRAWARTLREQIGIVARPAGKLELAGAADEGRGRCRRRRRMHKGVAEG